MDKQLYDRREVNQDEKERTLDLSPMELVPPEVGICEAPVRIYAINHEWAKIVMGMVSWLATIAPWRDAQDDTYIGIQEILTFMVGCEPCDLLASCISTINDTPYDELPEGLQDLADALQDNQQQNDGIGSSGTNPVSGVNDAILSGCDNDLLFGYTKQMVKLMDRLIKDAFEVLELITDWIEFLVLLSDLIPVAGTVAGFAAYLQNTLIESYLANYDLDYENEIACGLFCLAQDSEDCTLSWFQITDYFADRLSTAVSDLSIEQVLTFLSQGVWTGDEFCDASMLALTFILQLGGDWTGVSFKNIQIMTSSFLNDPDSDWEVLCTECAWEYTIDFPTDGAGNWVLGTDFNAEYQGVFNAGVGWQTTAQNNAEGGGNDWSRAICIQHDLSVESRITFVEVVYDITNSGHWDGSGNFQYVRSYNGGNKYYDTENAETDNGSDQTLDFSGNYLQENGTAVMKLRFLSGRWWSSGDPGGEVTLRTITVRGLGDNPFE